MSYAPVCESHWNPRPSQHFHLYEVAFIPSVSPSLSNQSTICAFVTAALLFLEENVSCFTTADAWSLSLPSIMRSVLFKNFNGKTVTVAALWNFSKCFGKIPLTRRFLHSCAYLTDTLLALWFLSLYLRSNTAGEKHVICRSQFSFLRCLQNRDIFTIHWYLNFCGETGEGLWEKRFAHKSKPSSCLEWLFPMSMSSTLAAL